MILTTSTERTTDAASALAPYAFTPLPLGSILPQGWLADQLRVQADGLTGHLDEFWPSVADSRWIGGENEGWERAPYWLDGLIPLAVLLNDKRLLEKSRRWVNYILTHQHADGWLGPKTDPHQGTGEIRLDPWPQFILFKALRQWYEATGDERIPAAMLHACRRIDHLIEHKPLRSWGKMRWADLVLSLHWLYERTAEEWLLALAAKVAAQGYEWHSHFNDFKCTEKTSTERMGLKTDDWLPFHGVNNAMGVKSGAIWFRQSGDAEDVISTFQAIEQLDRWHGQVTGMFSGDEHLAGRDPSQGTETCTVTEYLFTLEQVMFITGKAAIGDRIEKIAFNALPACTTKDMRARQYDQQPNQVLATVDKRDWVSNGDHANIFSIEGNFGCCTANLHQGWPKFASSLWMRSHDDGLAAGIYAPSSVTASISGTDITIIEDTDYPFCGEISLTVKAPKETKFPLWLRIPDWADGATVTVNDGSFSRPTPGEFHRIDRLWHDGDVVALTFPIETRLEERSKSTVSVLRGPLVMALRIDESFRKLAGEEPWADWEVYPGTPWNYGIEAEFKNIGFFVETYPLDSVPFSAHKPPVVLSTLCSRAKGWDLVNNSAGSLGSAFEAEDMQSRQSIEFIPYGSTHLRISEFPILENTSSS